MKYPLSVYPHRITVDANKQVCCEFTYYGNELIGGEIYLYNSITNQGLMVYYFFGKNDNINTDFEVPSASTFNGATSCITLGTLGTPNYKLENGKYYKWKMRLAQKKADQFLFQGGIIEGSTGNSSVIIVLANPLLHPPVDYTTENAKLWFYQYVEIGEERRKIIDSIDVGGGNYFLYLESPFSTYPVAGTQYRVYCNYIWTPEYSFNCRKLPDLNINEDVLSKNYVSGLSSWFVNYSQEDNRQIKNYNWKIYDVNGNNYITGNVLQSPILIEADLNGDGVTDFKDVNLLANYLLGSVSEDEINLELADINGDGQVTTADLTLLENNLLIMNVEKRVTATQELTIGKDQIYTINNYNSIVAEDNIEDTINLLVKWCDFEVDDATDNKSNYIYIYGSIDHTVSGSDYTNAIKLTYNDMLNFPDVDNANYGDKTHWIVNEFTSGISNTVSTGQTITALAYDTFGTLLGVCTVQNVTEKGKTYYINFKTPYSTSGFQPDFASKIPVSLLQVKDIPTSVSNDPEFRIKIGTQKLLTSFSEPYYQPFCEGYSLEIEWSQTQILSNMEDPNYVANNVWKTNHLYLPNKLNNEYYEKGIAKSIVNSSIQIGDAQAPSSYMPRTILDYNNDTGECILNSPLEKYPTAGSTYRISTDVQKLVYQTPTIYSINTYFICPTLAIDKTFRGDCEIMTEDGVLTSVSKYITFPKSELDNDGNPICILSYISEKDYSMYRDTEVKEGIYRVVGKYDYDNCCFNLFWKFKTNYANNIEKCSVFREDEDTVAIDIVATRNVVGSQTNALFSFSDYCTANHNKYRYVFLSVIKDVDTGLEKYYKYTTDWFYPYCEGWSITALAPTPVKYLYGKECFYAKESWRFYLNIDSGDITQNINVKKFESYSEYPKVLKIGSNNYNSGKLTASLGTMECGNEEFADGIDKVKRWRKFITQYTAYILRSDKGDCWLVSIDNSPSTSYDDDDINLLTTVTFSYSQIGDIHDIYIFGQDLNET